MFYCDVSCVFYTKKEPTYLASHLIFLCITASLYVHLGSFKSNINILDIFNMVVKILVNQDLHVCLIKLESSLIIMTYCFSQYVLSQLVGLVLSYPHRHHHHHCWCYYHQLLILITKIILNINKAYSGILWSVIQRVDNVIYWINH